MSNMQNFVDGLLHPLTGRFYDKARFRFVFLWGGEEVGFVTREAVERDGEVDPELLKLVSHEMWDSIFSKGGVYDA